jgi:hypothetical protein
MLGPSQVTAVHGLALSRPSTASHPWRPHALLRLTEIQKQTVINDGPPEVSHLAAGCSQAIAVSRVTVSHN